MPYAFDPKHAGHMCTEGMHDSHMQTYLESLNQVSETDESYRVDKIISPNKCNIKLYISFTLDMNPFSYKNLIQSIKFLSSTMARFDTKG